MPTTTEAIALPYLCLADLERSAIEQALAKHHGNRTYAARELGTTTRTLQRKLKAWGMSRPQNGSRGKRA